MEPQPFESVLAAARAGAEWAWAQLYDDLAPVLHGYLRLHGAADPEDLVGEVFLQVVRSLDRFDGDERGFRSWVFTIAHHRLIDERRRRRRRATEPAPTEALDEQLQPVGIDADLEERFSTDEILGLFGELTDEQREVLVLRVVVGMTIPEVAEVLGRSQNATKALQHRALTALRKRLEGVPPYRITGLRRSQG